MKKYLVVSCALVLLTMGFLSASTTSTLDLVGFIDEPPGEVSLILSRTPEQEAPIDLVLGISQKSVGTLNAYTNSPPYKVSISSLHGFELKHNASENFVPYTMNITGDSSWSNGSHYPGPGQTVDFEHWATTDSTYDLAVSVEAVEQGTYPAGTYTDTLTFTIVAQE